MIKSAPVGPVAGGIMGCIMVLVLVVYAYRHQIHRRSHQHMSPLAAQGEYDWIHTSTPPHKGLGQAVKENHSVHVKMFLTQFRRSFKSKHFDIKVKPDENRLDFLR